MRKPSRRTNSSASVGFIIKKLINPFMVTYMDTQFIGNTYCEVSIDSLCTAVQLQYTRPPAIYTRDSSFSYSSF